MAGVSHQAGTQAGLAQSSPCGGKVGSRQQAPLTPPHKEDAAKEKRKRKKSPFSPTPLGRYLWNYFQFRRNTLRKEDKKK